MSWNLTNREGLLSQMVDIFRKLESENKGSACHEVVFIAGEDEEVYKTSPAEALATISNDVYWGEEGNWSEAHRLDLRTL